MDKPSTYTREQAQMFLDFAFSDLPRAIDAGVNFMTALSLLCYTEYVGRMIDDVVGKEGFSKSSFETAYSAMGAGYRLFDKQLKEQTGLTLYKMFRCGMVHGYFTDHGALVATRTKGKNRLGVGWNADGVPGIALENYARDLKMVFRKEVLSRFV